MTRGPICAATAFTCLVLTGCGSNGSNTTKSQTSKPPQAAAKVGVDAKGVIAFRRYFDSTQTEGAVFAIRPDGTGERRITHPPKANVDDQPAISPDGSQIAFERCPIAEDKPCHAYIADSDGGNEQRVPERCDLKPVCDTSGPAWGPDGRLVINLASGVVKTGDFGNQIERSEVVVLDLKRNTQHAVAHLEHWQGDVGGAAWSPDGRRLVYELTWSPLSHRLGKALFVVPASGGTPNRVTAYDIAAGDHPDWSPDGQWLIFRTHADREDGPSELATVHPDGSGLRRFNTPGDSVLSSSYSPDGKWIAYGAPTTDGQADVYAMHADGSGSTLITRTPLWDSAPDWGP